MAIPFSTLLISRAPEEPVWKQGEPLRRSRFLRPFLCSPVILQCMCPTPPLATLDNEHFLFRGCVTGFYKRLEEPLTSHCFYFILAVTPERKLRRAKGRIWGER